MASADPRAELECPACHKIYTDPVMLLCRHNFCRVCIDRVLDTQEGSGDFFCPVCTKRFMTRPLLQMNIILFNKAKPYQEESKVFCTYCVDSNVPAVRSCQHCDAYLCYKHLNAHSTAPPHILSDLTTPLQSRKCSTHNELLKYYCVNEGSCICVSCSLAGEHRGHRLEMLDEASEKKKETLRNVLMKLQTKIKEREERVLSLQEYRRKVEVKAAGEKERVQRCLEDLEKKVLREISGQAERISNSVLETIRDLEKKKDKLSSKMNHVNMLCNMTDPLTVLQQSATGDLCDTEDGDDEDRERHDRLLHDGWDLDVAGVLHTGLSDMISGINVSVSTQDAADILLDVYTANNNLQISDDRKTASWSVKKVKQPRIPKRFQDCPQVLSSQSFSSGRHYWEVDVGGSNEWIVGLCYPSIGQRGESSEIGGNTKSWGLDRSGDRYWAMHDKKEIPLATDISSKRIKIDLDYEAGRISFYDVCDPIRKLHTFTTTFTEPLHAGFAIKGGCITVCAQRWVMSEGGGT